MLHGRRLLFVLLALGITTPGCQSSPTTPPAADGPARPGGTTSVTDPADPSYAPEADPELDPEFDRVEPEPTEGAVPDGVDSLPGSGWIPGAGADPQGAGVAVDLEPVTDRDFIDELVPTLLAGLKVLDHAIANTKRPELKALAMRLKPDWQARVKTLRAHRQAWYGDPRVPASDPIDLSYLEPNEDYDWMVADEIIRVLQSSLDIASIVTQGTPRDEIRTYAQELTSAMTPDRDQLNTWVETWIAEAIAALPQTP